MPRALFLSPEPPVAGAGGGGLRSASLLAYLRQKYSVDVVDFKLRAHSTSPPARVWRNAIRLARGVPPLFDRYSGYESHLERRLANSTYALGVVEHFWCASYAPTLRPHCGRLVLDLHNIESELARTHARAAGWPASWASKRFAEKYRSLEREWLPKFDTVLVASEEDRRRIEHPHVVVYPNALKERDPARRGRRLYRLQRQHGISSQRRGRALVSFTSLAGASRTLPRHGVAAGGPKSSGRSRPGPGETSESA